MQVLPSYDNSAVHLRTHDGSGDCDDELGEE